MIKTNTRRRVVSVLLALVMLVSLMPSLVVPAHAFWDDYGHCNRHADRHADIKEKA